MDSPKSKRVSNIQRPILSPVKPDAPALIRSYESKDLETCRALWAELTEWHRIIYEDPSIGGCDPGRLFDKHLDQVGPERLWVAEKDGTVVGLAGLILETGQAELEPVVVKEGLRGLGIGRVLAEVALEAARRSGVNSVIVRPTARNGLAIRFFHRLGFDVLGQIELVLDFRPRNRQKWKAGETIASSEFKV